ncbi:MAG TPA: GNAT family N-acetyltransferase [Mycobacteriales bacterium]
MIVKQVPYDDPVAAALRADLLADLAARYGGEGDGTPIAPGEFDPPGGAFLVAWLDGEPAGCAGWRSRADGVAELKRMWVALGARRRGVAKALLAAVEASAREAGRTRMVLETGTAQPEAMALYAAQGYAAIPNYGHYADSPQSRSYARDL